MPPKKRGGSSAPASASAKAEPSSIVPPSAATKETCCVGCQTVHIGKNDALFCRGSCQQWLHRYCASVTVPCYKSIKEEGIPFFCFWCCQVRNQREKASLTSIVEQLKFENTKLKESLGAAQSQTQGDGQNKRSYASVISSAAHDPTTDSGSNMQNRQAATATQVPNPDRKYNVVVYGVEECPQGTPKHARLQSDLKHVVSVMSKVDNTICLESIKDCYRLGKFKPNQSLPRPVLVKFIRISDVSSILSKKGDFSQPFSVKPDLSPEERHRDSLLLKARWSLIQAGTDRSQIKIRGSRLYVNKKLYCQVVNSDLQLTPSLSSPLNPSQSLVPSDSTCLSPSTNDTSSITASNSTTNAELPATASPTNTISSSSLLYGTSNSSDHLHPPSSPSTPTVQPPVPNSD